MQPFLRPKTESLTDSIVELPGHSRLPRLDLGVEWEPSWREFRSSLRSAFTRPRPPKEDELAENSILRIQWIRDKLSLGALTASSLWHIAVVLLLLLPIWGFLPSTNPNLAPVRIELTWYAPKQDLPPIKVPGPAPKPSPPGDPAKPLAQQGAEAYHPRQTILSMPVHITHPRQTLIQPSAPSAPPKIEPQLPNIVEWAATAPKPQLHISPSSAAPRARQRIADNVIAPEVANAEKNPGPLNIASIPATSPQPKMPLNPMSASVAERRQTHAEAAIAPEIGPDSSEGDTSLHRLIALSASPAPPSPEVSVPQGNLSARVAVSPDGKQAGVPGASVQDPRGNGGVGGNPSSIGGTNGASGGGGNAGPPPAGVSISGVTNARSGSGGAGPSAPSKLKLNPMPPLGAGPVSTSRRGPADVGGFDPSLPPEKILSGKEIYPVHVNMPNLSSATGSWILNCAQLDAGDSPYKPKGAFSGPSPIQKIDPKYPPELIKQHVDGEVVLYAIIRKDGSVDSVQLLRGLEPQLDRNAMEALAQWKFHPGTRDGLPIDIETVAHIPFHFRTSPDY